jgi:hypothetical protein
MKWGIYDVVDGLWLGHPEEVGPKVFDSEQELNGQKLGDDGAKQIARVAAQIAAIRAGVEHSRYEARVIPEGPYRERDEIPLKDTTLNVLRKLERGVII